MSGPLLCLSHLWCIAHLDVKSCRMSQVWNITLGGGATFLLQTKRYQKATRQKTTFVYPWETSSDPRGAVLRYKYGVFFMFGVFLHSDRSCVDWPFLCKENKNLVGRQKSLFHSSPVAENFHNKCEIDQSVRLQASQKVWAGRWWGYMWEETMAASITRPLRAFAFLSAFNGGTGLSYTQPLSNKWLDSSTRTVSNKIQVHSYRDHGIYCPSNPRHSSCDWTQLTISHLSSWNEKLTCCLQFQTFGVHKRVHSGWNIEKKGFHLFPKCSGYHIRLTRERSPGGNTLLYSSLWALKFYCTIDSFPIFLLCNSESNHTLIWTEGHAPCCCCLSSWTFCS